MRKETMGPVGFGPLGLGAAVVWAEVAAAMLRRTATEVLAYIIAVFDSILTSDLVYSIKSECKRAKRNRVRRTSDCTEARGKQRGGLRGGFECLEKRVVQFR